ncbi:MAG: hypothetical protein MJ102_05755 [Clostridia bacterium]|nr:hypothetical protein [Clostridia bacterium]
MKNVAKTVCILFAVMVFTLLSVSCDDDGNDKTPVMSIDYVAAVADKGIDTELSDLRGFRHGTHGPLYEFPLSETGFTLWAYYDTELSQLDYIMLSADSSENKLYIFYRDKSKLEKTEQQYDGPASGADVYEFVEKNSQTNK